MNEAAAKDPCAEAEAADVDRRPETGSTPAKAGATLRTAFVGAAAGAASASLIAAGLWVAGGQPGKALAVLDLNEVVEIEQTRLTMMVAKPGTGDDDRLKAYAKLKSFGDELSKAIGEVQAECRCTLLNRSAYIGEVPRDYTPQLKAKLGMEGVDLAALKQLTAQTLKDALPSVDLMKGTKGK